MKATLERSKHASYTTVIGEVICNKMSGTSLNLFYLVFLVLEVRDHTMAAYSSIDLTGDVQQLDFMEAGHWWRFCCKKAFALMALLQMLLTCSFQVKC